MPGRLLRLLSLLQTRREWPGSELARRLGVTTRTLRRDVDRLRALDYPVHSTGGTGGGYRLGQGSRLPPLLLDDEEAVAVGVALATAAAQLPVAGLGESATRALAKLAQVLPARLRPRLAAFGAIEAAVSRRVPTDGLGTGEGATGGPPSGGRSRRERHAGPGHARSGAAGTSAAAAGRLRCDRGGGVAARAHRRPRHRGRRHRWPLHRGRRHRGRGSGTSRGPRDGVPRRRDRVVRLRGPRRCG